jgi:hypothetical protein
VEALWRLRMRGLGWDNLVQCRIYLQYQDVRFGKRDGGERDAGPLSTRQGGSWCILEVRDFHSATRRPRRDTAARQVATQYLHVFLRTVSGELLLKELQGCQCQVNLVRVVLIHQCVPRVRRALDFALGGLELTHDELHRPHGFRAGISP